MKVATQGIAEISVHISLIQRQGSDGSSEVLASQLCAAGLTVHHLFKKNKK